MKINLLTKVSLTVEVMKSWKSSNCVDGFKKTLQISRFCGIMPIDEQCHIGPLLIIFSTTMYIFQIAFIFSWFWFYYIRLVRLDINNFLTVFRMVCNTSSLVLISYRFVQKREELRAVMWSLTLIDKELISNNIPWEWSIKPTLYGGNLIIILVPFFINAIYPGRVLAIWLIALYTDLILLLLSINQFCTFLNLIKYCLKQIGCFRNIESLPKLYSVIECFWQVLNDIYGPGITCIIVALYLGILHLLYNMFSVTEMALHQYLNAVALTIIHSMILLQIILTCQKLAVQVRNFNKDLYQDQKHCRKLLDSEELKFHFETMEEFEFTACHFFPVNVSLIGSMILSGTTYLVTLLQFTPSGIQKS